MADKKKRCYIYIRVSTSMQVEGFSLDAQREKLMKYASYQKMEVVREYCDAGKSGKNISGRPEFSRMLNDVANGFDDIDYILVFKLSRFGRNALDVLNSLQYIQDYGVNLICVEDGIDSSKDSGKLTITVLSAVAEIERENILVQTMEGRKQKAREGKWNGGMTPYGYVHNKEKSILEINPKEAEVVKLIFERFANDKEGYAEIAEYLNTHGYTKKKVRGTDLNSFTRIFVKNILDNPVYIGKLTYGKTTNEKIKGERDQYHRVAVEDYLITDGLHEPIIDIKLWDKAEERKRLISQRYNRKANKPHEYILSGIVKCPKCGAGLAGTVRRRKNKTTGKLEEDYFYRCTHKQEVDGKKCDLRISLNEKKINWQVETVIRDMSKDAYFSEAIMEKLGKEIDIESLNAEKNQLFQQLTQANGAKDKLLETLDALEVTDRHYDKKYADMQKRLEKLYDKIMGIEVSISEIDNQVADINNERLTVLELNEILKNFDKVYDKMTDIEKRNLMNKLIERVEICNEKKDGEYIVESIEFKFPLNFSEDNVSWLHNEKTVETVCLLCNHAEKATKWANVTLTMDEYNKVKQEIEAEEQK